jgi:multidrug efflux system outer membrane protein
VRAEGPGSLADLPWWELFRDPALQGHIRTGLTESKDVRIDASRIAQARALWAVTRPRLLPQIGTGPRHPACSPRWDSRSASGDLPSGLDDPNITLSEVGLGISFDLDLWGKPERLRRGALDLLASEEARQAVVVMLVGDVARSTSTSASWTSSLTSRAPRVSPVSRPPTSSPAEHGLVSTSTCARPRSRSTPPTPSSPICSGGIAQTENRLSVLLGLNPDRSSAARATAENAPGDPAGLPSALLAERRPTCVRPSADRRRQLSDRRGRAAFSFQHLCSPARSAQSLASTSSPAPRASGRGIDDHPALYTGGRPEGQLSLARARNDEAVIRYAQAVQQAFREVNDALVANQQVQHVLTVLERQLVAARDAMALAQLRYINGLTNYLDVLKRSAWFTSEVELVARRDRLAAVVQIYRNAAAPCDHRPGGRARHGQLRAHLRRLQPRAWRPVRLIVQAVISDRWRYQCDWPGVVIHLLFLAVMFALPIWLGLRRASSGAACMTGGDGAPWPRTLADGPPRPSPPPRPSSPAGDHYAGDRPHGRYFFPRYWRRHDLEGLVASAFNLVARDARGCAPGALADCLRRDRAPADALPRRRRRA